MLVPSTYQIALLLAIISALCWGSWANTQKINGPKWRFELYYIDYTLGAFLCVVVACFTLGAVNQSEITFTDSLIGVAFRKIAFALGAGVMFGIANILFVAAISVAGMALAYPVVLGIASMIAIAISYFLLPSGNITMLGGGIIFLIAAIVVTIRAYRLAAQMRRSIEAANAAALNPPSAVPLGAPTRRPRKTGKTKSFAAKGVLLSIFGGVFMGFVPVLIEFAREGDFGISPYATLMFTGIGFLLCSLLGVVFLMNFPLEGEPMGITAYFNRGGLKTHLLGIAGGVFWMVGLIASVLAASVPKTQNIGPAITLGLNHLAILLGTAWGIFVWKEFAGAGSRVASQVWLMFVLLGVAAALISLSPIY